MNALCSQCKCCEAQPDFDKCIFCEDGVPCPNRQRAARPAITTSAPVTPLVPRKRGRPHSHLGDNSPAKPAPVELTKEEKLPAAEPRADVAGFDGWLAEKNRYREKRKQIKERTVRLTDEERATRKVCPCGTLLRKDNSDGLCKVCRKAAKKDAAINGRRKGRPRKSQAAPPRNSSSKPAPPANGKDHSPLTGVAMLCVTETHLNNFLLKLSLDEKTAIVQRHLEGV